MKSLLLLLALIASSAMASTMDGHTFPINGAENEEHFLLKTTQTRTAYRQETVANTCYRTELDGYRQACEYYPEVRCYETRNGPVCSSAQVYRCQTIPNYREVPYTCYQTVQRPYEVFDHQVVGNFNVKISSKPKEPSNPTSCQVGYTMEGDVISSHADCNDFLILAKQKDVTEIDASGALIHNVDVDLKLLDPKTTLAPVESGIAEMNIEGNTLSFRTGDLSKNKNFTMKLFIERKRLLKSDETLIDRFITPAEYTFYKINEHFGIVKINLEKLIGGINAKKKHIIKLDMSVNLGEGTLLNKQMPNLNAKAEITVNN